MTPSEDVQIIHQDGKPLFAVVPYEKYLTMLANLHTKSRDPIPSAIIALQVEQGLSRLAAWRTHIGLSQLELAERLGVSQSAVAQMEKPGCKPREKSLQRVASALGVGVAQLVDYE
ncbi:TPA: helix-turn-helix domain-containing protein [Aeromonas hydrophila]|uniref:helix-turn-helix domain-containing protein n=1 Tax=Aeromonas hydrophila TaxID=644 RepID=UPI002441C5B4|nr:helix-turn-helix transcriptional regulator [Aeromonas hydrophila]